MGAEHVEENMKAGCIMYLSSGNERKNIFHDDQKRLMFASVIANRNAKKA